MGISHSCGTQIHTRSTPDSGSHPINPINSLGPAQWLRPKTMGQTTDVRSPQMYLLPRVKSQIHFPTSDRLIVFLVVVIDMEKYIYWAAAIVGANSTGATPAESRATSPGSLLSPRSRSRLSHEPFRSLSAWPFPTPTSSSHSESSQVPGRLHRSPQRLDHTLIPAPSR